MTTAGPGPVRCLVVDDHEIYRAAVTALLTTGGSQVVATGSGGEALDLTRALDPDLVVLDVDLAGRDGFDVAAELSTLHPRPTVLMVTARDPRGYADRARQAPVVGCLAKELLSLELVAAAVAAGRSSGRSREGYLRHQ